MILAGFVIAVGVVVDDAIIDIENIVRRLRQHRLDGRHPVDRARSSSSASLEVRGAIIYATLIDVVALVPVLFMGGLSGAFFQPARGVVRAGRAGLDGRRPDRDPGPGSDPAAPGAARAARVAVRPLAAARLQPRPAPGSSSGRARRYAAVRRRGRRRRGGRARCSGSRCFPTFKERDFLMHWMTAPGTSHPETGPDRRRRAAGSCGRSRACATSARTSARRCWATRSSGSTSPRTGSASTRTRTTTRPWPRSRRSSTATPGCYRDVQTYLKERINEVLTGTSEDRRGPHLRARPGGPSATRPTRSTTSSPAWMGSSRPTPTSCVDVPQIDVEVDLAAAERYGLKPGDVRRAAATLVAGEEVG